VEEARCNADGVPILRRSSGGGTVLLGPGCLLYTLVLRIDRHPGLSSIASSYRHILGGVGQALGGGTVRPAGISDLVLEDRKFSGNAQQRKRDHLLHHGTLLYAFDLASVGRYLRPPLRQPEYRAGRPHADFLCNLSLTAAELKRRLRSFWQAANALEDWPEDLVRKLTGDKYGRLDWVRRR
jgi:lipoate-protein ligase A